MTDEERQRTMDFILSQQAQFAANMQKLEEVDARASKRLGRLERMVVLLARQFRRERRDLRERISALTDAQMRSEEAQTHLDEKMNALVDAQVRTEEAMRSREDATRSLEEAMRSLAATTERNSIDIAALARANKPNGEGGGAAS